VTHGLLNFVVIKSTRRKLVLLAVLLGVLRREVPFRSFQGCCRCMVPPFIIAQVLFCLLRRLTRRNICSSKMFRLLHLTLREMVGASTFLDISRILLSWIHFRIHHPRRFRPLCPRQRRMVSFAVTVSSAAGSAYVGLCDLDVELVPPSNLLMSSDPAPHVSVLPFSSFEIASTSGSTSRPCAPPVDASSQTSVDRFDKATFTSHPSWSFRFRNACVGSDAPMQCGFNSEGAA